MSISPFSLWTESPFPYSNFVIKLNGPEENPAYPTYVALELIKDKCALMDSYKNGDEVKVTFNLSGRLWQPDGKPEKCFTSLQAWRVEALADSANQGAPMPSDPPPGFNDFNDDIPF